ncbi:MAG TPA: large conductance mechanosensitive channel protein MscL [Anaerolineales bacterium]|nr:large conductance mechanosensitive channel protein MscL [Anaerolineales bacterium]
MLKEFRQFALRGNALDLAVGIILGAGFTRIVNSFVSDVLMPPIGLLLGRQSIPELFLDLSGESHATLAQAVEAGAATVNYGLFLSAVVDFVIVALAVFFLVKSANRLVPRPEPEAAPTRPCPFCLSPIPVAASRCAHCTSDLKGAIEGTPA